ncbi:2Fe-2S iron-sulfur cluster binding domain-containing protein [Clostridium sp. D2Q-11]|uniref:2Fe-2S iron-sulfur cluster binding domain-containing protein n=1 Tax=Anaeromonas frigoriresistens TaxID=2683708 RepID=A0A942USA9_9FIRM|nr:2Fe-2S iron-sulfur cluster binding domain-containing protein [Anaeromonas frigoriresistens]MBS4537673.1 2Fe-2S iron-sulfur cluster binding domain-containing protein [Anaeromonas frigoriresistens]
MGTIIITVGAISGITGILAFLLTLAKNTIGNYGEVIININDDEDHVVDGGTTLLSALIDEKIFIPSACGGKGSCGYCKVKVNEGAGPILPTELGYLTPEDKKENVRLSCQVKVKNDFKIEIPEELFNVQEYEGKVSKIVDLTPTIKHLTFDLKEGEIDFKAGQYVQLRAPEYKGNDEEVYRAYSIASSPSKRDQLELIIGYVEEGIATTYVHHHLEEDEEVLFNGPYGDFFYQDTDREMVMVAIGTGMAPILSILYHMVENNINRKATFYFGARYLEDLFFVEELQEIEKKLPNFKFIPSLSRAKEDDNWTGEIGRVTDAIEKYMESGENKEAYLCGSPRMIDSTVELLKEKGMQEELIFYDKFE